MAELEFKLTSPHSGFNVPSSLYHTPSCQHTLLLWFYSSSSAPSPDDTCTLAIFRRCRIDLFYYYYYYYYYKNRIILILFLVRLSQDEDGKDWRTLSSKSVTRNNSIFKNESSVTSSIPAFLHLGRRRILAAHQCPITYWLQHEGNDKCVLLAHNRNWN